ncbi:MAG: hypothetical protein OH319_04150 [Candidatus Parvarchaeota archaeon]|nr:hypothetical protein [Candidatus Jingweiarchaeum tengchongense]MCW1298021.1 hypothetical protein [Candidatus Jingweiarchaeum tengchongense]MCW1300179.1 hypothetical protein [Candidatus Jingweiarchaeum tengchongense]MCW1304389.1 hypothetical protein [Candidatus Jingweiarchaeum tengchongense]MCW1310941.1 hypothetical protein [Candidatus Jingweiarchaeum tengchongense]
MDIPFEKVAFAATIVYVVGIMIFSLMFNIIDITKRFGKILTNDITTLKIAPWILSLFYFSFVFSIIFYLIYQTHKKKKEEEKEGTNLPTIK